MAAAAADVAVSARAKMDFKVFSPDIQEVAIQRANPEMVGVADQVGVHAQRDLAVQVLAVSDLLGHHVRDDRDRPTLVGPPHAPTVRRLHVVQILGRDGDHRA